ncbi:MAG: hypothetical protein RQ752_05520 [Thermohalobaculum sp.]|nr:hypothetical protein [Thermohalobaculum sp.]
MTLTPFLLLLLVIGTMGICAAIPMLSMSWRMLGILSAVLGSLVGLAWFQFIITEFDKECIAIGTLAVVVTAGWALGTLGALVRLAGRPHGWRFARFPLTEVSVAAAVLLFSFLWWMTW